MAEIERATGWILSVTRREVGSILLGDHAADSTVLLLRDAAEFNEAGGDLSIGGTVLEYAAADWDDDTVTLEDPLPTDLDADTPVVLWDADAGAVTTEVVAEVELANSDDADSDPISVDVPLPWQDRLPLGVRPDRGETVEVQRVFDDENIGPWEIANVYGVHLKVDASHLDPTTLPDPVAIVPPTTSPTLSVTPLLEEFILQTEPVGPRVWLTYQVSTDYDPADPGAATWSDLPDMPVKSTIIPSKKHLPDGTSYALGAVYTFRVIAAHDADGSLAAAPSEPVTRQLNPDTTNLVASLAIFAQVIAGHGLFGTLSVAGDSFTISPVGDPLNPAGGVQVLLPNGGRILIPADGSSVLIEGADATLERVAIISGLDLGGPSKVRDVLELSDGVVDDPTDPPDATAIYRDVVQTAIANPRGFTQGTGTAEWATLDETNGRLVELDADGSILDTAPAPAGAVGVALAGSTYYVLAWAAGNWRLVPYDATLVAGAEIPLPDLPDSDDHSRATIGYDVAGGVAVAVEAHVDGAWTGDVVLARIDPTNGTLVEPAITVASPGTRLGGVAYDGGDLGGPWTVQPETADGRNYTAAGVVTAETWERPYGRDVRGYGGSQGSPTVIDQTGIRRSYGSLLGWPTATFQFSYELRDGDGHATAPSPERVFTRPRGAQVRLDGKPCPRWGSGGAHDPDHMRFFARLDGSGPTRHAQATTAPGVRTATMGTFNAGGAEPGVNTFPAGAPGLLRAEDGGAWFDGLSDGDVGTGGFRDSVQDAAVAAFGSRLTWGTGSPEGVVTAPPGSAYIDDAATNGAIRWVKRSGTGNTGWRVHVGDTGWRRIASWTGGVQDAANQLGTINTAAFSLAGNGFLDVRRLDHRVMIRGANANADSPSTLGTTSAEFFTANVWPTTFWWDTVPGRADLMITSLATAYVRAANSAGSFQLHTPNAAGVLARISAEWPTSRLWPTSLPGIPVA